MAVRSVANMIQLSIPKPAASTTFQGQAATLLHRRGLAGGTADHHGTSKVNFWEDPMNPARWKREPFVIITLTACGILTYEGYKYFIGDKKNKKDEKVGEPSH
ncbi:hypothetical protein F8388_011491 [Cannabis sativa]|uniref:Uncharacterized protein n=1 Tax=Cannabis sativa TaxID=3483 RepID=A0A7J6DPW1_CANSA|nr:hypothetical protein G4B88_021925 [Cannabis sativa]KAF4377738.1 hypothetical protein F8388_011491 [Cannabis sativa]